MWRLSFYLDVSPRTKWRPEAEKGCGGNLSAEAQKSLRRKQLREWRHRAQSLVEGATDPWEQGEGYETPIPEAEEEEFIDEETAEVAEECDRVHEHGARADCGNNIRLVPLFIDGKNF